MKKQSITIVITALICLTILEVVAMLTKIDGYLFSLVVIAIAGIAGYQMPAILSWFRKR